LVVSVSLAERTETLPFVAPRFALVAPRPLVSLPDSVPIAVAAVFSARPSLESL
jgi:hypothetical protein